MQVVFLSLVLQCIVIGALFISFEANKDFIPITGFSMDSFTIGALLISFAAIAACIPSILFFNVFCFWCIISFKANEDFIPITGFQWILLLLIYC